MERLYTNVHNRDKRYQEKKNKINWGIHYLNWGSLALCSEDFNIAQKRFRILYDKIHK